MSHVHVIWVKLKCALKVDKILRALMASIVLSQMVACKSAVLEIGGLQQLDCCVPKAIPLWEQLPDS